MNDVSLYPALLSEIKARISQGQLAANQAVNNELTALYWDIGRMIHERQQLKGWGAGIIPKLSSDLTNELPETRGFSERNLKRMLRFYREYALVKGGDAPSDSALELVPQPVALLPWGHNAVLFEQVKDLSTRLWYAKKVTEQGWSRATLLQMIRSEAHARQGNAISNFEQRLPAGRSELVQQQLKDPYIFDFLTIAEPFRERELESGLLKHLEAFLLELGDGFAFVGRQYAVTVSDQEYYFDLLFYHLTLRAFIVVELKRGDFKPEYAGKMNFYCSIVDEQLRHETDQATIGLILCQTKDRVLAEYALRGIQQPIGVSDYELTRALPDDLQSSLPSISELEAELSNDLTPQSEDAD